MILNNIIINSDNQLVFNENIIKKLKKLSDINSKLILYETTNNYQKINNLDLYNQMMHNKITLYQPTEYNGWLSLLDTISYKFSPEAKTSFNRLKILIDSNIYGSIELLKYIREINDEFYITESCAVNMSKQHYEYLKTMFNILLIPDIDKEESKEKSEAVEAEAVAA